VCCVSVRRENLVWSRCSGDSSPHAAPSLPGGGGPDGRAGVYARWGSVGRDQGQKVGPEYQSAETGTIWE